MCFFCCYWCDFRKKNKTNIYLTTNWIIWFVFFFIFLVYFFFHTHILSIFINENELVGLLLGTRISMDIQKKTNLLQTKTYTEKDLYFDLCHRSRNRRGISTCWIFGYWAHNQLNTICINIDGHGACVRANGRKEHLQTYTWEFTKNELHSMCWSNSIVLLWHTLLSHRHVSLKINQMHTITIWSNCKMTCKK